MSLKFMKNKRALRKTQFVKGRGAIMGSFSRLIECIQEEYPQEPSGRQMNTHSQFVSSQIFLKSSKIAS